MKISIALATYNGEKYLQEQLDSITNQTRYPDEVVITDDGSTDSTLSILNNFKLESRFPCNISINTTNKGTGFSFKRSIDSCKGDVIAFCDQDDIWLPNKLERIEKEFNKFPSIEYIISNANIIDHNSINLGYNLWNQRGFDEFWQNKFLKGNQFKVLMSKNITTGMTTAISKKIAAIGNKKPDNVIHDAWYIYIASISGLRGFLINESLINYRQHLNQQFGALRLEGQKRIHNAIKNHNQIINNNIKILEPLFKYAIENIEDKNDFNFKYLKKKLDHFKARKIIIESSIFSRFIKISHEILKGGYFNFGSWKNILIDLFIKNNNI